MLPIHSGRTIETIECVNSFTRGAARFLRMPTPTMTARVLARSAALPRATRIAEGANTMKKFKETGVTSPFHSQSGCECKRKRRVKEEIRDRRAVFHVR